MSTVTMFDIEKFDGKISFSIWKIQMKAVLTHNALKKALAGKSKKPDSMTTNNGRSWMRRHFLQFNLVFPKRFCGKLFVRLLLQVFG
ncbi:hypothetical protein KY289_029888 [Solanum tuberosum]|nr:hypothetical protein KY289_029888 [Solanum tuberosum]